MLTDERIIVANAKTKQPRFVNRYSELNGLTKSIRIGAQNFIIHFRHRGEEEWFTPRRDEMIQLMQELFLQQTQALMPVFGLGSVSLEDFVTSEKDV